jgi:hypothetical protein
VDIPELDRTPEFATEGVAYGRGLGPTWETAPGIRGWLSSVDHKEIGLRYIVTAFAFLCLGGLEALLMRAQLSGPNRHLLTQNNTISCFPPTA